MKTFSLFACGLLCGASVTAQNMLTPGYFITDSGERVECLIYDKDWKDNPDSFRYKLAEDGDWQTGTIDFVKEFGIENTIKFKKFAVKIDRSSEILNDLSHRRLPDFHIEHLFLKTLVEGPATLYYYEDVNLKRFFYQIDGGDVEQLVYKLYRLNNYTAGKNMYYQQQLWNDARYPGLDVIQLAAIKYERKALVRHFTQYNEHRSETFEVYGGGTNKDLFNLTIRPGLNVASLDVTARKILNFETRTAFRIGAEAEFILPFNNNKWAIVVEPAYHYFRSEDASASADFVYRTNYTSLQFPAGVRYYTFLPNSSHKIFANVQYLVDISLNSWVEYSPYLKLEASSTGAMVYGLGYGYGRYSVEARYTPDLDVLTKYVYVLSDYTSFSLVVGYNLF